MKRFFYINKAAEANPRTNRVLKQQQKIGVQVYRMNKSGPRKLLVLYKQHNFGWIVETDEEKNISKKTFTTNPEDIAGFRKEIAELEKNPTCRECNINY